jgi:hypothetical protein
MDASGFFLRGLRFYYYYYYFPSSPSSFALLRRFPSLERKVPTQDQNVSIRFSVDIEMII